MAKMLPNLMNTVNPQMQEAQWIPVSRNKENHPTNCNQTVQKLALY